MVITVILTMLCWFRWWYIGIEYLKGTDSGTNGHIRAGRLRLKFPANQKVIEEKTLPKKKEN